MNVKETVDKHFTENIKYYSTICQSYYNRRYLWEDLRQEAYIAFTMVKESTILYCRGNSDMLHLGKLIIKGIYNKRSSHKRHIDGSDSPLFELSSNHIIPELIDFPKEPEVKNNHIEEITALVFKGLADEDFDMGVFVMNQSGESINKMSKRTNINRSYLSKANEAAKQHIRKNIAA